MVACGWLRLVLDGRCSCSTSVDSSSISFSFRTVCRRSRVPGPRRTCAARLATQAADFADAHRAEHLEQLGMPRADQVHDPMDGQIPADFLQGDRARVLFLALAAQPALQGHDQGDVDGHQVGAADDGLGQVLGLGDPAGGDQRDFVADAGLDQRRMNLAQHVARVTRRRGAGLSPVRRRTPGGPLRPLAGPVPARAAPPPAWPADGWPRSDSGFRAFNAAWTVITSTPSGTITSGALTYSSRGA